MSLETPPCVVVGPPAGGSTLGGTSELGGNAAVVGPPEADGGFSGTKAVVVGAVVVGAVVVGAVVVGAVVVGAAPSPGIPAVVVALAVVAGPVGVWAQATVGSATASAMASARPEVLARVLRVMLGTTPTDCGWVTTI